MENIRNLIFKYYRRDMSLEGACCMMKKFFVTLSILTLLIFVSCSCSENAAYSEKYGDGIGVRVDGTAKLIIESNDPIDEFRWIALPDYLPIDDCEVGYDVYIEVGDVWICVDEPESSIEILSVGDKIEVKIIQFNDVLIGKCTIRNLSKTLLCENKFTRE